MQFKTLPFIVMMLILPIAQAQDTEYPTLDALANLEIPGYSYVDRVRRISRIYDNYVPPSKPPDYQLGDRQLLRVPVDDSKDEPKRVELRGMTENVLIWVEMSVAYSRNEAQAIAERVEEEILVPLHRLFNYAVPPGVDGDPRYTIVIINNIQVTASGFFPPAHAIPRTVNRQSNQREMVVINLALDDGFILFEQLIVEVAAHEYQHILMHHRDFDEENWLSEAFSTFSEYYTFGEDPVTFQADEFLAAPDTALTKLNLGDNLDAKYGAGNLFMIFIAEQYGNEIMARLHAESADGWRGVDKVLRESAGVSADTVFADWVLANYFLDADRGYGYQTLDPLLTPPLPVATIRAFPALHSGSLPQYSSDYLAVNVRGAEVLSLRLTQAPEAYLINATPYEGDHFYYAVTTGSSNSKLTRSIDLRTFRQVWLEYRIWYDLAEHKEFGYIEISTDRGKTWRILQGEHTEDKSFYGHFYANGYTGSSDGWLHERVNLSDFASRHILLRFEVYSNSVSTYRGLAIDDLHIDTIDHHDGFESPDDAWIEEGWIRTDNRLPQRTWLQVVQENAEGLQLSRHLMTSSGELAIDMLPGVSQALIAISPVVPQTSLQTEYALEVNLIDADRALMASARDCTVTTTHGLNFRDAPNGDKIGLLPQGAAVMALDHREGWFLVEYDSKRGWISGDYVTARGDCD